MLRRLDLRAEPGAPARSVLPRAAVDVAAAAEAVRPVVEDVARRGYRAAREASVSFDGVDVADPRVTSGELSDALTRLDS
jgi:histidinol dehydrogenase